MKPHPIAVGALLAGLLLVAGCSGQSEPALATTTAPDTLFGDAEFVATVRDDDGGYFDGKPDTEIFETADVVCGVLARARAAVRTRSSLQL